MSVAAKLDPEDLDRFVDSLATLFEVNRTRQQMPLGRFVSELAALAHDDLATVNLEREPAESLPGQSPTVGSRLDWM